MTIEIDVNDAFGRFVVDGAATSPPTEPRAFYNIDGDCIEYLVSDESYYAERVDPLLTVYYGRETGEVVGSLIKGVKRFMREVAAGAPGFLIEVEDGKVHLKHLLSAGLWKIGETQTVRVASYKKLRQTAEDYDVEVEVPELVGG